MGVLAPVMGREKKLKSGNLFAIYCSVFTGNHEHGSSLNLELPEIDVHILSVTGIFILTSFPMNN